MEEFVLRAYRGVGVHADDVKVRYQGMVDLLGGKNQLVSGSPFPDMTASPIREANTRSGMP
ncbi:MAG: hypothetical protein ACOX2K_03325 [Bacillota bacterium]|jgi:hypothetical protein